MNATREIVAVRRWPETLRWGACFALALSFHVAGAAALLARWSEDSDLVASAPVIMIELAALPVAPETVPNDSPPDQQQPEPQPEPEKKVETPPEPQSELQVAPPPKPKEQKQASLPTTPSTAERKAERAAARAPGSASLHSDALPNWKSALVSKLERSKRYPSEARARGEQGVAQLAFSVDRSGGVHHARIVRSSGSSLLDEATLALVERAAPLPPPPPEVPGTQIAIVVPIRYSIR